MKGPPVFTQFGFQTDPARDPAHAGQVHFQRRRGAAPHGVPEQPRLAGKDAGGVAAHRRRHGPRPRRRQR